jgi:hypothetical protein
MYTSIRRYNITDAEPVAKNTQRVREDQQDATRATTARKDALNRQNVQHRMHSVSQKEEFLMDIQLHQQVLVMTTQLKSVCDLLAQVETKQSFLLHSLLPLAEKNATPASPLDSYDTPGDRFIQRLISGK